MAIKTDYSSSSDQVVNQLLRWDDTAQWIEVTQTINLDAGKTAYQESIKTYRYGDTDYNTIKTLYGLNPQNHDDITVYKYLEMYGSSSSARPKIFLNPDRPYTLANRPHQVVIVFRKLDSSTSTTSGVAL